MNNKKILEALQKFDSASQRLTEALAEDDANPLAMDGTIQRFEFVFELLWKTLKRALEAEGMICQTARETLKTAYQIGWISPEELWLQMLDDRNMTSHTYDQPTAKQIYANIQTYHPEIQKLAQFLHARCQS